MFISGTGGNLRGRVARELTIGTTGVDVLGKRGISGAVAAALTIAAAAVLTTGPRPETVQLVGFAAGSHERSTGPFSMLGVTWDDPAATVGGAVQVRTRAHATGRWTGWQALESDGSAPGDARGATDPLWVGDSDGVQARVAGTTGPLPAGLRVELINPGTRAVVPVPVSVATPARPVPRMITRAGWGANETIVHGAPLYGTSVQVFFVHHTATGNDYSCADSAAIVRGIQAYQVRGKGWDDIGYNFLVDKCGTVFEGRAGGVGRPVTGAHTLGFNTDAAAIAVIGDYGSVGVPPVVRTAIATVAAYKLGAYGNPPNGTVELVSHGSDRYPAGTLVTLDRISGHRDTGRTECPGDALYAQLGEIRAIAGAAPYDLHFLRMVGAARRGSVFFTKGLVKPLWTLGTPSPLIARFEVLVDGRLTVAAPGTHRLAPLRLTPGGHTVTVRAVHLSGRSATVTTRVLADPYAPVFTSAPGLALRTGSLDGSVPARLTWAATDVNGLSAVTLLRPSPTDLGITAYARDTTLAPARTATFTVRATDRSGNARDASVTGTPTVRSETATTRTGVWRTLRDPRYLGGTALGSAAARSTATWTFTGRSAALAAVRGPAAGPVRIFVDGADQGLIDLRSPQTAFRQAVWSRSWPTSQTHTVRAEAPPGTVLDGLVSLA